MCLDSCHLLASGFDVRTAEGLAEVLDDCDARSSGSTGSARCTSTTPDAAGLQPRPPRQLGEGELGDGCAAFLSEPRFEGLPCVLETRKAPATASTARGRRRARAACAPAGARKRRGGGPIRLAAETPGAVGPAPRPRDPG